MSESKKIPRSPDSRRMDRVNHHADPRTAPAWHVDDQVRFAHGPGPFTITAVTGDGMVELKELPGQFGAHLFVAAGVVRFD